MLIIAGYFAAILIGVALGLIGGGGSILTVPVLVYLLDVEPVLATAYSLFIVGVTALIGAIPKCRANQINLKIAFVFGIPSIIAVYLTRAWLVPHIPSTIATINGHVLAKPQLFLLLFAFLMIGSAVSMIRSHEAKSVTLQTANTGMYHHLLILLEGFGVGTLTGLVGAGGGFLIVPALVMLVHLPMKTAIGTSLLIIGLKSLLGFAGDLQHYTMDWSLLLSVTALAAIGILIGTYMGKKMDGQKLKHLFGWFVLVMGLGIVIKEVLIFL